MQLTLASLEIWRQLGGSVHILVQTEQRLGNKSVLVPCIKLGTEQALHEDWFSENIYALVSPYNGPLRAHCLLCLSPPPCEHAPPVSFWAVFHQLCAPATSLATALVQVLTVFHSDYCKLTLCIQSPPENPPSALLLWGVVLYLFNPV